LRPHTIFDCNSQKFPLFLLLSIDTKQQESCLLNMVYTLLTIFCPKTNLTITEKSRVVLRTKLSFYRRHNKYTINSKEMAELIA